MPDPTTQPVRRDYDFDLTGLDLVAEDLRLQRELEPGCAPAVPGADIAAIEADDVPF